MQESNEVAVGVITELTKAFFSSLANKSVNFLTGKYAYLFDDFEEYLQKTYQKCNQLKVIINKTKPYSLDEIYVKTYFQCGTNEIDDQEVIQQARDGNRLVVTGFGGIGKTIFSKKLWTSVFSEPHGKIPIYFELRQLNSITDIDLFAFIRLSISSRNQTLEEATFNQFVDDGPFLFILDGFDELPDAKRDIVERQILTIAGDCPNCGLVVSGRFDERFNAWERFTVFKAIAFSKPQVEQLIKKVDFEERVKSKFLTEIIAKRFDDYQSFLETPLLALMMLMAFSQSGEVPEKRSLFYKYAFLALYSWHDGSKEAFKRESKTGLDIEQFEKLFSIFCLLSYIDHNFQMDRSAFFKLTEKCRPYVSFEFCEKKFLNEVTESVNLLYQEGDTIIFTHRSFQEYFSAFACVTYFQSKLQRWSYIFDQFAALLRWIMVSFRLRFSLVLFFFHKLLAASIFRGSNADAQYCSNSSIFRSLCVPASQFQMR
ncbi:MAG: NACHT domain-containing protein [Rhizobiaceae bacterium]|nr:NACHT domain-containing protein [Rhizobiaceae bacterium]